MITEMDDTPLEEMWGYHPGLSKRTILLRQQARPNGNGGVGHSDSIEKIMWGFSTVSPEPVLYGPKQKLMGPVPKKVVVGPAMFRRFTCHSQCNACCAKLSLDYLPGEFIGVQHQEGFSERFVKVNGTEFNVMTNPMYQQDLCQFLVAEVPGRALSCSQFPNPPLSCISAPQIKFGYLKNVEEGIVSKRPYGRAWAMKTTPQCEFDNVPLEEMNLEGDIEILTQFIEWADYFNIPTVLPAVQQYLRDVLAGIQPVPTYSFTIARFNGTGGIYDVYKNIY